MSPSIADVHQTLTGPGALFEIVEAEIRGVRTRVWKHAPPSLRAVLDYSRLHGELDFLVYEDERTSFAEHYAAVATLARRMLEDWGLHKGERVAIAMRNYPEWSLVFWATVAVGAVSVPLNAWWKGEELEYGLRDSGSTLLFCDAERAAAIASRALEQGVIVNVTAERVVRFFPALNIPEDDLWKAVDAVLSLVAG